MTAAEYLANARRRERLALDAEDMGDGPRADSLRALALLDRKAAERAKFAALRTASATGGAR